MKRLNYNGNIVNVATLCFILHHFPRVRRRRIADPILRYFLLHCPSLFPFSPVCFTRCAEELRGIVTSMAKMFRVSKFWRLWLFWDIYHNLKYVAIAWCNTVSTAWCLWDETWALKFTTISRLDLWWLCEVCFRVAWK